MFVLFCYRAKLGTWLHNVSAFCLDMDHTQKLSKNLPPQYTASPFTSFYKYYILTFYFALVFRRVKPLACSSVIQCHYLHLVLLLHLQHSLNPSLRKWGLKILDFCPKRGLENWEIYRAPLLTWSTIFCRGGIVTFANFHYIFSKKKRKLIHEN